MKRAILLPVILSLFVAACKLFAQTTYNTVTPETAFVTGTVKDASGNFLRYAFVRDSKSKAAVYTDSLGNFVLKTSPASALIINCNGFKDTVVQVGTKTSFAIVLRPNGNASGSSSSQSGTEDVLRRQMSDQVNTNSQPHYNTVIQQGSLMPMIHTREETQGSRYIFKTWAHGYVVNSQDSMIQNPAFLLNYDKTTGGLLLTQDNKTVIEIDKGRVKSFTLFDDLNQPHVFTMAPPVDNDRFAEVLADGKNYKIYKLVKTKFIPSDYKTDGIASTGNNYDEYRDDVEYYVLDVKTNTALKTSLRKKALKQSFEPTDQNKAGEYLQANSGDIDDRYLSGLGDYMNK